MKAGRLYDCFFLSRDEFETTQSCDSLLRASDPPSISDTEDKIISKLDDTAGTVAIFCKPQNLNIYYTSQNRTSVFFCHAMEIYFRFIAQFSPMQRNKRCNASGYLRNTSFGFDSYFVYIVYRNKRRRLGNKIGDRISIYLLSCCITEYVHKSC